MTRSTDSHIYKYSDEQIVNNGYLVERGFKLHRTSVS